MVENAKVEANTTEGVETDWKAKAGEFEKNWKDAQRVSQKKDQQLKKAVEERAKYEAQVSAFARTETLVEALTKALETSGLLPEEVGKQVGEQHRKVAQQRVQDDQAAQQYSEFEGRLTGVADEVANEAVALWNEGKRSEAMERTKVVEQKSAPSIDDIATEVMKRMGRVDIQGATAGKQLSIKERIAKLADGPNPLGEADIKVTKEYLSGLSDSPLVG